MTKNPIRPMSSARRLCTAAAVKGTADYKPLYRRLSALGGDPGRSVAQTMNQWIKEGRFTRDVTLMTYVKLLRKYKRHKHALELMDWMETKGMEMSTSKHAVRLDLITKVKGIDSADIYLFGLPESEKNLLTYGALLSCYCSLRMADKAIALYEKMKELHLISGSLVYNNIMNLYLKLDQPDKVQSTFQEMKANNIYPDIFTYNILTNSYSSLKEIDSIERLIQEMEVGRLTLDWTTYANLAGVYNSAGLYEKADSALKKAEILMGRCNRGAFEYLISLYAGAGNLAEVNRVWNSLNATFMKPTNMSYYAMLLALSKLDDMDALKQCFEKWESDYVNYDIRLVIVTMGAYLRKGMTKDAESLCRKAMKKGVGSNTRTLELFIDYFLKRRETDLALKCFKVVISQVKQRWWKPYKGKLSVFMKYF